MAVSRKTTYLLWLLFGWSGLHHLYLGRLNQAIVWFATLGGGCGVGWVRDYWRIPEYIKWSSPDKPSRKKFLQRVVSKSKPECSRFRHSGMILMGSITATALGALVPDMSDTWESDPVTYYLLQCIYGILRVLGTALGVYLVANIGELRCSLYYPFVSSLCIIPIMYFTTSIMGLASSITVWFTTKKGLHWRHLKLESPDRHSEFKKFLKNVCLYLLACVSWLLILVVGFYLNGSITTTDGESISGKEAFNRTFMSNDWQTIINNTKEVYSALREAGLWGIWNEITTQLDISGKISAYMTLGVFPGTSQDTISKICRKLLAENHPDRFKVLEERASAEVMFIDINKACSRLSVQRSHKTRDENE